jgi:hypothetical protein
MRSDDQKKPAPGANDITHENDITSLSCLFFDSRANILILQQLLLVVVGGGLPLYNTSNILQLVCILSFEEMRSTSRKRQSRPTAGGKCGCINCAKDPSDALTIDNSTIRLCRCKET